MMNFELEEANPLYPIVKQFADQKTQIDMLSADIEQKGAIIADLQKAVQIATDSADGQAKLATRSANLAKLISYALYIMSKNPPYVFGGESLSGMDCSGFLQYLFKNAIGVKLPRVSESQINTGTQIPVGQEQPGDLVGFDLNDRNGAGIEHIGLCIGNGLMIHTAKAGENINIADYRARYGSKFVKVARIF